MNETDYNARLYEKMKAEQDKYRDWLLHQEPSEILNHTYEYTMREDIVMCMEELELEPEKATATMNNGGDAAEQIVRLSLEGFEVAAKLTGSAAKNVALLLVSVLKQEQQTKGKARLTNMIRSGKELKVFSLPQKDIQKFTEQAKRYGVLYCLLRDKNTRAGDAPVDIIARAEDASKIQRICDRFELGKIDKAGVVSQAEKDKADRGNCQIHYIRNVVLEKIVLEAINSLADFVRCYEPVFLYLMAQKDIVSKRTETNRLKSSIESGKRRIQDLDKLIERIYEDQVLGNISAERYARMSINYENEQRELVKRVDEDEKRLVSIEQTSLDLKTLLKVLRSSTAFEELTPTLVNSLIRRIEVHNNDKSSGHCSVKVDIYFTAIGLIDIPTEDEIKSLMEKIQSNPQEYRLTA